MHIFRIIFTENVFRVLECFAQSRSASEPCNISIAVDQSFQCAINSKFKSATRAPSNESTRGQLAGTVPTWRARRCAFIDSLVVASPLSRLLPPQRLLALQQVLLLQLRPLPQCRARVPGNDERRGVDVAADVWRRFVVCGPERESHLMSACRWH